MPKEVRYLLFSPDEVLTALIDYPLGSVAIRPRIGHQPQPRLKLFSSPSGSVAGHLLYDGDSGDSCCLDIGPSELLSALLTFCASMRLVLPRLSHKSLELMSDRLVMSSTLSIGPAQPETARGGIRYSDPEVKSLSMSAT